jgi:hypothetical protein
LSILDKKAGKVSWQEERSDDDDEVQPSQRPIPTC